eukprot:6323510-Lingulodinium_polyedra.AAC.1
MANQEPGATEDAVGQESCRRPPRALRDAPLPEQCGTSSHLQPLSAGPARLTKPPNATRDV